MPRNRLVVALAGWTFLVWTTRIGNVWNDAELDGGEKASRIFWALTFTLLAVAVTVGLVRRLSSFARKAAIALAAWTIVVWLVRTPGILFDDHAAAFKAVHTALAIISIVLAAATVRAIRPDGRTRPEIETVSAL